MKKNIMNIGLEMEPFQLSLVILEQKFFKKDSIGKSIRRLMISFKNIMLTILSFLRPSLFIMKLHLICMFTQVLILSMRILKNNLQKIFCGSGIFSSAIN